jgi:asparagine synthase (glutamine-hydrolysing)
MQDVAAIPTPTKAERSATKRLFRDAMRGWLPDRILDRPKQGFGIPLCEWFRGALRNLPGDVLLDPRSIERGLFRRDAVETLIDDHMVGAADNSGRIWALMQLELWLRAYVDPQRVESPPALAVS